MQAPRWSAAKTRRLIGLYNDVGIVIYACLLVKNTLIIALNQRAAAQLRWLDCYLLGRLQVASRIPEASKYCTIFVDCYLLASRLLFKWLADDLLLLLYKYTNVRGERLSDAELARHLDEAGVPGHKRRLMLNKPLVAMRGLTVVDSSNGPQPGIFYHWLIFMYCVWCLYVAFIAWMTIPMSVTRRGFALLYPNCLSWTARQLRFTHNAIYPSLNSIQIEANSSSGDIPFMLPLVDFVPLNPYHLARIVADLLECCLSHADICVCFSAKVYLIFRITLDLLAQVARIEAKLKRAANRLGHLAIYRLPKSEHDQLLARPSVCERALVEIQADLIGYFRLVRAYNPFVSATSLVVLCVWLFYTFLVFGPHLKSRKLKLELDHGVQLEFVSLFFANLLPFVIILASEFIVGHRARRTFNLVARVMALDDGTADTKRRWLVLLGCYRPRCLYCFNFMNMAALTWLFGLKLFSWIVSALVILYTL